MDLKRSRIVLMFIIAVIGVIAVQQSRPGIAATTCPELDPNSEQYDVEDTTEKTTIHCRCKTGFVKVNGKCTPVQRGRTGGVLFPDLDPPGDCTKEQHKHLQNLVNAYCKIGKRQIPLSCRDVEAKPDKSHCGTLRMRAQQAFACSGARQAINDTCFRGGNFGHLDAQGDAQKNGEECRERYEKECAGMPPVKLPSDLRAPVTPPLPGRVAPLPGRTGPIPVR